jgi:hypothetical protein
LVKITLSAGFLILKVGNFQSQTFKRGVRTHFLKNEANFQLIVEIRQKSERMLGDFLSV